MAKEFTTTVNGQTVKLKYQPSPSLVKKSKSPLMKALLLSKAKGYRDRAASMYGATNYGMKIKVGQTRARAIVYTADRHAMHSNRLHNTIRKAMGGGSN